MSDTNDQIVFGSIASVSKYKRSKGMKVDVPNDGVSKKPVAVDGNESVAYIIGGKEGEEVDVTDEELQMLDNILVRNDPDEVYMQEDFSFYDEFYLNENKVDDELLQEVRKIRRIYKSYEKYMYACYIREKYMDSLEEQYAMGTIFKHTGDDLIVVPKDVFIPPYPIFSRNSKDYDAVMSGTYSPPSEEVEPPTEEEILEILDSFTKYAGLENVEVVPGGIETFRPLLEQYDSEGMIHSEKWSGPSSVSVTDLDELQKLIRSWHKKEDQKVQKTRNQIPFPQSEEGIKRRYYNEMAFLIDDYIENQGKEEDENEMVYDDVTKKPMTKKEYQRRQTLRMLSEQCGWDMVKLMSQLSVGSKMERKLMRHKQKSKKKARKKATDLMSSITGTALDIDWESQPALSGDELRSYLFGDD